MAKTKESTLSIAIPVMSMIDFGIFDGKILFTSGYTLPEIIEELKKQDCNDYITAMRGWDMEDNCRGFATKVILRIKRNPIHFWFIHLRQFDFSNDDDYCTLAHECLHLVQFRLKGILDRDREFECEAYLHTHLMKQCLKVLRGELL